MISFTEPPQYIFAIVLAALCVWILFHDLIDAAVAYLKAKTRHLDSMAHGNAKKDSDAT